MRRAFWDEHAKDETFWEVLPGWLLEEGIIRLVTGVWDKRRGELEDALAEALPPEARPLLAELVNGYIDLEAAIVDCVKTLWPEIQDLYRAPSDMLDEAIQRSGLQRWAGPTTYQRMTRLMAGDPEPSSVTAND